MRKGDIIELTIEKMVYGGRGLAHHNNRAVFVDAAIPGERVMARASRVKKDFAEARLLEVLEPSQHRAIAPCRYNHYCGGCNWQFIEYEKQLEHKHAIVEELLHHIGKVTDVSIHPVLPAPHVLGYRNKMEFSFSDKRWQLPEELDNKEDYEHFALGLHVPGTFDKIINIDGCLLQHERGNEILREVKKYARGSGLPVYGLRSHQGFWRYLVLRHSHYFDEWMVNIVTSEEREPELRTLVSILRDRFGNIESLVQTINTRRGGTAIAERENVLLGRSSIRDKIGEFTFEISAQSFFQTNTAMAERLYEQVRDLASLTGKETVIDLYCGIGTISILLAPLASRVIGMDISESSIQDARKNCELNAIYNCEFLCGDVKVLLSRAAFHPNLLIADPPRAGIHKKVIEQILYLMPDKIIYVSCNPSTLARDLALLNERYLLGEVQPLDLFPHTHHVETVVLLEQR
ncbi:MAG TPA: 23S rRNA (uracil(1939)-C(5))-methyltransferase RlmD [Desulfatiglandales bacterium]|nr:23S rRNA (uracil(1939)-C(5))-methyltransferase RlmD [Desulfatiglandales bacterium]